jgi:hypothetical protein
VGDLGPALSVGFLVLMVGFPLIVFYGVLLGKQPTVIEMRRILAWYQIRWPWPMRTAVAGMLPFGLGGLIASAGRAISGRTATLEGFPGDVGQDLLIIGVGVAFVGSWFMLRPPAWVLPAWYRDVLARHEAGLDPAIPPPRSGAVPAVTRRQRNVLLAILVGTIIATPVFSLPATVASGAFFGLAILATYVVRQR